MRTLGRHKDATDWMQTTGQDNGLSELGQTKSAGERGSGHSDDPFPETKRQSQRKNDCTPAANECHAAVLAIGKRIC